MVPIYTEAKDHEFARDPISGPQLEWIKRDLKRRLKHFPGLPVTELTAEWSIGACRV